MWRLPWSGCHDAGMRKLRWWVVLLVFALVGVHPAGAKEPFAPLEALTTPEPSGQMLFFALADGFEGASVTLVPAARRRLSWVPEGAQLNEVTADAPPVLAVGSPPPQADSARYLVPVLDGAGTVIDFVPRRLEGDLLVALADDAGEAKPGTTVVPVLVGPLLEAPTGVAPARVLEDPVEVDAQLLEDPVPTLLVRRAAPGRVVFGVRVGEEYVPLVDETGLAFAASHEGKRGIAVPVPEDFTEPVKTGDDADPVDQVEDGGVHVLALVIIAAAVLVPVLVVMGLLRRRRRGRRRSG